MYIFPDYISILYGMYVAREYFVASIDLSDWMKEINRVHCSVNDIDRFYLIRLNENVSFVMSITFFASSQI